MAIYAAKGSQPADQWHLDEVGRLLIRALTCMASVLCKPCMTAVWQPIEIKIFLSGSVDWQQEQPLRPSRASGRARPCLESYGFHAWHLGAGALLTDEEDRVALDDVLPCLPASRSARVGHLDNLDNRVYFDTQYDKIAVSGCSSSC